jgi:microcin C transport system permease protein
VEFHHFDFGKSYFRDVSVLQLIKEKLPVSMSLGIWMTLLTYLISIPLGIRKAGERRLAVRHLDLERHHHRLRDPGFLFGSCSSSCSRAARSGTSSRLRGLTSDNFASLPWYAKILDYFWHLTLPLVSMALAAFATMSLLTKNSFLDEIRKQYVLTARAKGCYQPPGSLWPQSSATRC